MKKILIAFVVLFAAPFFSQAAETNVLQLSKRIELPHLLGRIDHLTADVAGQRLFVAALENNSLEIVDLKAGKHLGSIPGLPKPAGVFYLPESNRIYVACGGDGTCKIYDGKTFKLVKNIEGLDDADNLRYDAKTKLLYVGFGGGALGLINVAQNKLIGAIPLKAHPEAFVLEKNGPRIFVNLPERKQIIVLDREKKIAAQVWSLQKVEENFPMALDEKNQRLFVGCRQPAALLVLDAKIGKVVAAVPISSDTDDLFFDEFNKRLYVSGGEGYVDVIQQIDANHYKPLEKIPTGKRGRTSLLIPELKLFCVATPARPPQSAEIWVFELH